MICPKCQSRMNTYDRQGVRIEQCERCRGIFLDHGELEQILSAEQRHYGAPAMPYGRPDSPAPYRGRPDSPGPYRGYPDSPPPHGGYYNADSPPPYGHHKRRRKSFLEDLFD
ncbi:TFIIB-type zinc ribbon-containing protein [Marinitenerispora sediminis]|uniref:Transcriptional regulator n=1 Tax=Marinitenerispora sediminis TaxID=1931232 RepID=A0A368T0P9_9ACTN|nr:zf-TFIIB domain-containing protein [Marinitenerispora sediminis]RCV48961.1 transcriptional regulator [Marinitenerispora sediminis]RCV52944.1 transcriptional regulator [Marinitenerispora sediminis]RCV53732.1 transcriptional regulator [Marinitenerispora sediminis]